MMKMNNNYIPANTRILYIEDNPFSLEFMESLCSTNPNILLESVSLGVAGLKLAETGHYDLVITDLLLPDISADELLTQLTSITNLPVITLTGNQHLKKQISVDEAAISGYLTKPIDITSFWIEVNKAISIEEIGRPNAI